MGAIDKLHRPMRGDGLGVPGHSRRLSDKILAAFNHAYAVGKFDIARRLKAALAAVEDKAEPDRPDRRAGDALQQAELWVAFVEARTRYRRAQAEGAGNDADALAAAQLMTEAFKRWSFS